MEGRFEDSEGKIKVINADCLEYLKEIPNDSVDLVLTDPPYTLDFKKPIDLHGRKAFYDSLQQMEWDKINIRELYASIFPEFNRIIKKNGSIIIFVRTEMITYCIDEAVRFGFKIKATITWHKTNPVPQVRKKNYLSSTESILWFSRWNDEKIIFTINFKKQKEMHNFIELPICSGNVRTSHPTQKPLDLIKHFLEIHSNPNDLVLDCFAGSGTTGVACLELGRRCILIERERQYYEMILNRIKPYLEQRKLC